MKAALKGVIHGRTIELEQDAGLPDGHEVSVTVEPVLLTTSPTTREALASLRRAAGVWADDSVGLDHFLEWICQQHKGARAEVSE
jgi:hypothetical protein